MIVHQVLSGAGPRDAITTEARAFRARFDAWGWGGQDHAARFAPGLEASFRPLAALSPDADDVVLVHHSAAWPDLDGLLAQPGRRMLLHHNVTPSTWLWDAAPVVAALCALGRAQLPELVAACHLVAADSAFNASELTSVGAPAPEVLPLLVDLGALGDAGAPRPPSPDPHVLFVGRLSPHKRQDRVIDAFAHFRRVHAPAARLTLVGEPLTEGYAAQLRALGDERAPGAVAVRSGLSESALGDVYRAADVFLCLSEHEGFCVPLLEAMALGVPVIARAAGAVAEVAGDAALIVSEDDPGLISELLHIVSTDHDLRDELIRRGRDRVAVYDPGRVSDRLRDLVRATAGAGG